jgi:hypothetical protein
MLIRTAMKGKRTIAKQKTMQKDFGKDLFDSVVFLIILLTVLWYFNI